MNSTLPRGVKIPTLGCLWKLVTIVSRLVYNLFTGRNQPTYIGVRTSIDPKKYGSIPVSKTKPEWGDLARPASILLPLGKAGRRHHYWGPLGTCEKIGGENGCHKMYKS